MRSDRDVGRSAEKAVFSSLSIASPFFSEEVGVSQSVFDVSPQAAFYIEILWFGNELCYLGVYVSSRHFNIFRERVEMNSNCLTRHSNIPRHTQSIRVCQ